MIGRMEWGKLFFGCREVWWAIWGRMGKGGGNGREGVLWSIAEVGDQLLRYGNEEKGKKQRG